MTKPLRPHTYHFAIEVQAPHALGRDAVKKILRGVLAQYKPVLPPGLRFVLRTDANMREHYLRQHERYRQRVAAEQPRNPKRQISRTVYRKES